MAPWGTIFATTVKLYPSRRSGMTVTSGLYGHPIKPRLGGTDTL